VLQSALGHDPYVIEAHQDDRTVGLLPLGFVHTWLFGRMLVSLPYVNTAGVLAEDSGTGARLVDAACELADRLDVQYLELRHEERFEHARLNRELTTKVHMRMPLPETVEALRASFKSKLRSQIKRGESHPFETLWGGTELLPQFYDVFAVNMRDLGTPVFSRRLFAQILEQFPGSAELCVLRLQGRPIAGALLVHGPSATQVPSASALRAYNSTSANMVMYARLLERAVLRGQRVFDFGRSSIGSGPHKFKEQWGAAAHPAHWQYCLRRGDIGALRPESGKYSRAIQIWQKLPVWFTRVIGPSIVRGIP
jgi:FemAB-related protein (PEP-CTERM system-associated)